MGFIKEQIARYKVACILLVVLSVVMVVVVLFSSFMNSSYTHQLKEVSDEKTELSNRYNILAASDVKTTGEVQFGIDSVRMNDDKKKLSEFIETHLLHVKDKSLADQMTYMSKTYKLTPTDPVISLWLSSDNADKTLEDVNCHIVKISGDVYSYLVECKVGDEMRVLYLDIDSKGQVVVCQGVSL